MSKSKDKQRTNQPHDVLVLARADFLLLFAFVIHE